MISRLSGPTNVQVHSFILGVFKYSKHHYFSHTVHCCSSSIHPLWGCSILAWPALIGQLWQAWAGTTFCVLKPWQGGFMEILTVCLKAQLVNTGFVHISAEWVFSWFRSINIADLFWLNIITKCWVISLKIRGGLNTVHQWLQCC